MSIRFCPVAASDATVSVLLGPPRPAEVLAVSPAAVYLRTHLEHPSVVGLVAADASRLPNAVTVPYPRFRDSLLPVCPGESVSVGERRIVLGSCVFQVVRWWRARPALPPAAADDVRRRISVLGDLLRRHPSAVPESVLSRLSAVMRRGRAGQAAAVTSSLLGWGPGSTPSGDDVLAGALAAVELLGEAATPAHSAAQEIAGYLRDHPEATTPLSFALLAHAVRGETCLEAANLLRALHGQGSMSEAADRVLGLGGHSGADIAHGLRIGVEAAIDSLSPVKAA